MGDKLIITYDKSTDDIPVLSVGKQGWSGFGWQAEVNIIKIFTGDSAVQLYNQLTQKTPVYMPKVMGEPTHE